jgi:hypothetical protein
MTEKLRQPLGIEYEVGRYAALAGHLDAPMHLVQFPDRMASGLVLKMQPYSIA